MVSANAPAGPPRGSPASHVCIARRLERRDGTIEREGEGAEAGEQVGDRTTPRQPFARRGDERLLAVFGRLQERARWKPHRRAAERHRHRLRLPHRLRPISEVDGQASKAVILREAERRLGRLEPLHREALEAAVDALIGERQLDIDRPAALLRRQHPPQRSDEREQLGAQDVALRHIDDPVRTCFAEAEQDLAAGGLRVERRAAAASGRRQVRFAERFGLDLLRSCGVEHAVADERRQRRFVEVLELAPAADGKMTARRCGAVRSGLQRTIGQHDVTRRGQRDMTAARRDTVAFRRDADDLFAFRHRNRS